MISGKQRENYGRGQHSISDAEFLDPEHLVHLLRGALISPQYQPPVLPAIALELIGLTQKAEVSINEVRHLLERDPLLAAQVLKAAQSALYGQGRSFASLNDAVSFLGLRTVSDIFLQTALSAQVFRAKGYEEPMGQLQRHSTATAHIARLICRETCLPDEYAFLCGLLHDVGMAAGIVILAGSPLGGSPKSTRQPRARTSPPPFEHLAPALETIHQEAAEVLARAWKLPKDVQLVLRHHHHFVIGGRAHPLAAAVCLADWLATEGGAGIGSEVDDLSAAHAARELRIDSSTKLRLRERSAAIVLEL